MFQESWNGVAKIYCILAISQKSEEKGSTVNIIEGGVNHTSVTFKLVSTRNHGLEYIISVYANSATKFYVGVNLILIGVFLIINL